MEGLLHRTSFEVSEGSPQRWRCCLNAEGRPDGGPQQTAETLFDDDSKREMSLEQASGFVLAPDRDHAPSRDGIAGEPTSLAAATRISPNRLARVQRSIVSTFQLARGRPLADEELIAEFRKHFGFTATDSSIRSRRRELERRGIVKRVDSNGTTRAGNRCGRYQLTDVAG